MPATQRDCEAFTEWLLEEAVASARGDRFDTMPGAPNARLWLGRISPQERVEAERNRLGDRGERLDPCEVGFRVRLSAIDGRRIRCRVRAFAWRQLPASQDPNANRWAKTDGINQEVEVVTPTQPGEVQTGGREDTAAAFASVGAAPLGAEVRTELELGRDGPELVITLVNVSPIEAPNLDTNLYQVSLEADVGETIPFVLEGLSDSFRYDRHVAAYGVNGGVVSLTSGVFATTDYPVYTRRRATFWDEVVAGPEPDLTFERLASNPLEPLRDLVSRLDHWIDQMWSTEELERRSREEQWDAATLGYALSESNKAREEALRVRAGLDLLDTDETLRRAFILANEAFRDTISIAHSRWRPFQVAFTLANIASLSDQRRDGERNRVDILWFPTGGGKTETYLLLVVMAAFYDRLTGKHSGITSWARFPLRMLSLDQTQRFADLFAAAELVRSRARLGGAPFSVGFFVGQAGTPNRVRSNPRPDEVGPDDPDLERRYRVLIRCPFCGSEDLNVRFDRARWALDHICSAAECPWRGRPLPFRIVDEEIYRWLPTVVLGTLDKAAIVSTQAAMRGFYGPPSGRCPLPDHGYTYAPRSERPGGCLFPGCQSRPEALSQNASLYAPSIRMQDELHLLRDSLGSVDAHYEALLDALQRVSGSYPKVIASSATLAGHELQTQALYRREGRTFPLAGPRANHSFWSRDSDAEARGYVGLAPRGVTIEYANQQLVETLQTLIRAAVDDPRSVATAVGVGDETIPELVSIYGVDVVYGSTLKDVEAAARSFEAEIRLDRLNAVTLTGRTPLEEVQSALRRLKRPEADYYDRIHLVAASSMLSHGVDINRLNVMIMLGLPLATAEFIQTTARIGRLYPGLVFVLHKIARERDAGVFRMFPSFVEHSDRLIDPIPITSKSRRILELTFAGLESARIYGIHEPAAIAAGLRPLTKPLPLKRAVARLSVTEAQELRELIDTLGFTDVLDENLRRDLAGYVREFFRALNSPATTAQWVSDLFPTGDPMRSLRDVEEEVPVYSQGGTT